MDIILINGNEPCSQSAAYFIGNNNRGNKASAYDALINTTSFSRYIKKIFVKKMSRGLFEVAYCDNDNHLVASYSGDAGRIPETLSDPRVIEVAEITYSPLEFWRKTKGMTLKQLSEASGIMVKSISRFETGERELKNASAETVLKLAKALGVSVEELLERGR